MDADFLTHWLNIILNPQIIYDAINSYGTMLFTYVTPTLLVIAIAIRSAEESLDVANSNGRWVVAFRDMIGYGLLITVYFGVFSLVAGFFNAVYGLFSDTGSLQSISLQLDSVMQNLGSKDSGGNVFSIVTGSIAYVVGSAFHYFSLLLVTLIVALLHIAQALGFGLAFCWGLIAIPMAITRNFSLLKGWLMFTAFVLVWPVIESFLIGLTSLLFEAGSKGITTGASGNVGFEAAGVLFVFTVLNVIVAIIAWVSPYLANSLVANAPAGKDFVTPFVAGAVGLAAAGTAMMTGSPQMSKQAFSAGSSKASNIMDGLRSAGGSNTPEGKSDESTSTVSDTALSSDRAPRSGSDDQNQARRGAIINNQSNSKT